MGRGRNLESGNQEIRKEDKSLTRESRKGGKQEKRIRVRKEEGEEDEEEEEGALRRPAVAGLWRGREG